MKAGRSVIAVAPVASVLIATAALATPRSQPPGPLPSTASSAIQHVVVVMMENRSFDHYLGWYPNADAQNAGLSYLDADGVAHETHPLAPDFMGCGHQQPDHEYDGGRVEWAGGAMDGFALVNDDFALGYYEEQDRPFFNALARNYTVLDHSFASILGPTYPNRIFLYAAQTDRLDNSLTPSTLPTIFDRLAEKQLSARYYFNDLSFLAFWGTKYLPISRTYPQFLADAAAGTLPKVAFVDSQFLEETIGTCQSEHPFCDIRAGEEWLEQTVRAVMSSPNWRNTVLVVTYDEWGGFFDHVAPPRAAAANAVDPDIVDGKTLLGFRVPTLVISPFTKGDPRNPRVNGAVYDHTSILKLIEKRWGLRPLTPRDASSDVGNLMDVLDFSKFDASLPALPHASTPGDGTCLFAQGVPEGDEPPATMPQQPIR
jgi:phospholipase C